MNTPTGNKISRANKCGPQKFTPAYKLQILEKGARCKNITELHALLHQEKLHAAQLSKWWREFSSNISFEKRFLKPIVEGSVPVLTDIPKVQSGKNKSTIHSAKNSQTLSGDFFEKVWRGRWAFSTTLIISMLISGAYVRNVTPLFTAHALLEVNSQHLDLAFQKTTPSDAGDQYNVQKEITILQSYPIVEKVIHLLSLEKTALLNSEIRNRSFLTDLLAEYRPIPHVSQAELSGVKVLREAPLPGSVTLMENVLNGLEVSQINDSRIIKISYTSESPELAANIANAIAETYINDQEPAVIIQWSDIHAQTSPQESEAKTAAYFSDRETLLLDRLRDQDNLLTTDPTQKVTLNSTNMKVENNRHITNANNVVSYAHPPMEASFPKVFPTLLLALAGSMILGLLAIFIQALSRKGFRSAAEIEQHTGLPSLGMLPQLGALQTRLTKPSEYVLKYPKAPLSEAVHSVYTNMLLARRKRNYPPKVIQFTSAYPREGRSTTAHCLAIAKRQSGIKTIIIDADIRKPNAYKNLSLEKQPGLAEYLSGESAVHQIITRHKRTGAYHIAAGKSKKNPTDILASRRVDELFSDLREVFDLIIVDSPPVLAVPDARILASRVDMTTLVVKWGDTRQEVVQYALRQLSEAGAQQLTTLLTMVDARKHALDTYADSGVYFGDLRRYFFARGV